MIRVSPLVWISLGLVSLTMTVVLGGNAVVDLVPSYNRKLYEYRKALSESLAVQYSVLASQGDLTTIQSTMRLLVERNEDILSAALHTTEGTILAQAGSDEQGSTKTAGDQSPLDHVEVAIFRGDKPWGTVHVTFRSSEGVGVLWLMRQPWSKFLAFVAGAGFLGYLVFMKRTLRQLDPSAVIPARVKAALDVLPQGVVMLDTRGSIVLANAAFAERVGREFSSLLGSRLSELPWQRADPGAKDEPYPWTKGIKERKPETGVTLVLQQREGDTKRFAVNSAPILDDAGVLRGVLSSFDDVTELDRANAHLREAVTELGSSRTQVMQQNTKLETANDSLRVEINERKRAESEREELNKRLVETSRRVGMADVASTVLHNVGNVLNGINVSTDLVINTVRKSAVGDLARIAVMLQEHRHDLAGYLAQDPKGKQIPSFLATLAESLGGDYRAVQPELDSLSRNVEHIKQIIITQQDLARLGGIREPLSSAEVLEQALAINLPSFGRALIEVVREYTELPPVLADRHQVLQILVNLISNAKNAMLALEGKSHRLTLRARPADNGDAFVRLQVSDTGIGIRPEHFPRLFTQGFTTRGDGHGLGLHSSALTAKTLGGLLRAHSDGEGLGATFTLDLPATSGEAST